MDKGKRGPGVAKVDKPKHYWDQYIEGRRRENGYPIFVDEMPFVFLGIPPLFIVWRGKNGYEKDV